MKETDRMKSDNRKILELELMISRTKNAISKLEQTLGAFTEAYNHAQSLLEKLRRDLDTIRPETHYLYETELNRDTDKDLWEKLAVELLSHYGYAVEVSILAKEFSKVHEKIIPINIIDNFSYIRRKLITIQSPEVIPFRLASKTYLVLNSWLGEDGRILTAHMPRL